MHEHINNLTLSDHNDYCLVMRNILCLQVEYHANEQATQNEFWSRTQNFYI